MSKYIIDANVALLAGTPVSKISVDQLRCAKECAGFIKNFIENPKSRLVLDDEGRILKEYRNARAIGSTPNLATMFCIWAHQHLAMEEQDFIHLNEIEQDQYREYPDDVQLKEFDPPDRKYIALAYKHSEKPPIVEASDSKWWGIKEALKSYGIDLIFIDEEYIKNKYVQKIGV